MSAQLLKAAVSDYGNQGDVAVEAGITRTSLVQVLNFRSTPKWGTLEAICRVIGRPIEDFVPGDRFAQVFDGYLAERAVAAPRSVRDGEPTPFEPAEPSFAAIPFDDVAVSAGGGTAAEDDYNPPQTFRFPLDWVRARFGDYKTLRFCPIKGDSMHPTLKDGDLALYDTARANAVDGIYVYRVDEQLLIKRLVFRAGGVVLVVSDNQVYPSYEMSIHDLDIKGRVIWAGGMV